MPGALGRVERVPHPDLTDMQREGVAPASFHLGAFGFGLRESIAAVHGNALDKVHNLAEPNFAQLGAQCVSVKCDSAGLDREDGVAELGERGRGERNHGHVFRVVFDEPWVINDSADQKSFATGQ